MATQVKTKIRRIDLKEAQERRRQLVFVDARSKTALARNPEQIPGAIHVPANEIDRAKRLPRRGEVVTYCT